MINPFTDGMGSKKKYYLRRFTGRSQRALHVIHYIITTTELKGCSSCCRYLDREDLLISWVIYLNFSVIKIHTIPGLQSGVVSDHDQSSVHREWWHLLGQCLYLCDPRIFSILVHLIVHLGQSIDGKNGSWP